MVVCLVGCSDDRALRCWGAALPTPVLAGSGSDHSQGLSQLLDPHPSPLPEGEGELEKSGSICTPGGRKAKLMDRLYKCKPANIRVFLNEVDLLVYQELVMLAACLCPSNRLIFCPARNVAGGGE